MPVSVRTGPLGCTSALQSEVKLGGDVLRLDVNANAPWTPGVPGQALVFRLSPDPKNRYWFGPSFTPPITPSTGPNLNPRGPRAPSGRTTTPGPTVMPVAADTGSAFPTTPSTMATTTPNTPVLLKRPHRTRIPISPCNRPKRVGLIACGRLRPRV